MFNARQSTTSRAAAPHRKMNGAAKKLLLAKSESEHVVPVCADHRAPFVGARCRNVD
jgi:hypothetical protein